LLSLLQIVEAFATRLAWIRDELDPAMREQALEDLEDDVAGWLAEYGAESHSPGRAGPNTLCPESRPAAPPGGVAHGCNGMDADAAEGRAA
jgi:hypothetical protein